MPEILLDKLQRDAHLQEVRSDALLRGWRPLSEGASLSAASLVRVKAQWQAE